MNLLRASLLFAAVLSASVLSACDDDGTASPSLDASVDMALASSELYGPCELDSQCPGEGAVCRKNVDGWPGGFCTIPCADRTVCDDGVSYNLCVPSSGDEGSFCERKCVNGYDCARDGYSCANIGGFEPASGGRCIGFCVADADCGSGAFCDTYTGECKATGEAVSSGAAVGDACDEDTDCRSGDRTERAITACIREVNSSGSATGYLGGYCLNSCILPRGYNSNNFFAGDALPQGTCDSGEVCYPTSTLNRGDFGGCFKECAGNSDCRAGYACRKSSTLQGGTYTFDNGVCMPVDCAEEACPSGYTCEIEEGFGTCVRSET